MPEIEPVSLSRYGEASAVPSPVNRMMAAFAEDFVDGYDINLGVGYVNEKTIPDELLEEALRAVRNDPGHFRQAFNYGGPSGSQNLRRSIRSFYTRNRIGGHTQETLKDREILIGASGATSLLEAVAQVVEPGIAVTPDPLYYIYTDYLLRLGFELLPAPEDGNGVNTDALSAKIDALGDRRREIRFIYVVTVANPTSTILSNERRKALVEIARRLTLDLGREVPLICDCAYELLIHDPEVQPPNSCLLEDDLGIVYEIGTLSKILAPALRIGFLIGSDKPLLRALVQRISDVGFSAPLMAQEMASYLLDNHIEEQIERVNQGYREKAVRVRCGIDDLLGEHLVEVKGGKAGFYFYLTFEDTDTREGSRFFRCLSRSTGCAEIDGAEGKRKPRVVYLPGEFCVHPKGDLQDIGKRQIRLSYGFEETDRIGEALGHIAQAVGYSEG